MYVDVEPGVKTAAAVASEAAAKCYCLYWRYLCSIEGVAAAGIAAAPSVAVARDAAAVIAAAAAAGVAAARGGGGPQEAMRPSRWWCRIV